MVNFLREREFTGKRTLINPQTMENTTPDDNLQRRVSCVLRTSSLDEDSSPINTNIILDSCHQTAEILNDEFATRTIIKFDRVFDANTPQAQVYDETVGPLVDHVMHGENACLLSYGQPKLIQQQPLQTSKLMVNNNNTHNNYNNNTSNQNSIIGITTDEGFILFQEFVFDVLNYIEADEDLNRQYVTYVSCVEICDDTVVRDLLNPESTKTITLTEKMGIPFYSQSHNYLLKTVEDFEVVLQYSAMNRRSHQSHVIFVLRVNMVNIETNEKMFGSLCWFDLACPERIVTSNFINQQRSDINSQLKSARGINRTLYTLGSVLSSMNKYPNKKSLHWRDCKLTRALNQVIDQETVIVLLINISLSEEHHSEAVSSIQYGQRILGKGNIIHGNTSNNSNTNSKVATAEDITPEHIQDMVEEDESMRSVNDAIAESMKVAFRKVNTTTPLKSPLRNRSSDTSTSPTRKSPTRVGKSPEKTPSPKRPPSESQLQLENENLLKESQKMKNLISMYEKNLELAEDYNQKLTEKVQKLHTITHILQKNGLVHVASTLLPSQGLTDQIISNTEETIAQLIEHLTDQEQTIRMLWSKVDSVERPRLSLALGNGSRLKQVKEVVDEFSRIDPHSPISMITIDRELRNLDAITEHRKLSLLETKLNEETLLRFELEDNNRKLDQTVKTLRAQNEKLRQRVTEHERSPGHYNYATNIDLGYAKDGMNATMVTDLTELMNQARSSLSPASTKTTSPSRESPSRSESNVIQSPPPDLTPSKQASMKLMRKQPSSSPVSFHAPQ